MLCAVGWPRRRTAHSRRETETKPSALHFSFAFRPRFSTCPVSSTTFIPPPCPPCSRLRSPLARKAQRKDTLARLTPARQSHSPCRHLTPPLRRRTSKNLLNFFRRLSLSLSTMTTMSDAVVPQSHAANAAAAAFGK